MVPSAWMVRTPPNYYSPRLPWGPEAGQVSVRRGQGHGEG